MKEYKYAIVRIALVTREGQHMAFGNVEQSEEDQIKELKTMIGHFNLHIEKWGYINGFEGHELAETEVLHCPMCEPYGGKGKIINANQEVKCFQCGDRRKK